MSELGVTSPEHIDLEAIALIQGAKVRYVSLDGCEARILGTQQDAVVSINSRSRLERQRFSLAHELGHWHHHRGQSLFCRATDIGGNSGATQAERVANRYAADLLMPGYIFDPLARNHPSTFASIDLLAREFTVSRTAAAIRLVERCEEPTLLVKYTQQGRIWFCRSKALSLEIWPRKNLHPDSPAFSWLYGKGKPDGSVRKAPADQWIDGYQAKRFDLKFQAAWASDGVYAILQLDERMVAEF